MFHSSLLIVLLDLLDIAHLVANNKINYNKVFIENKDLVKIVMESDIYLFIAYVTLIKDSLVLRVKTFTKTRNNGSNNCSKSCLSNLFSRDFE